LLPCQFEEENQLGVLQVTTTAFGIENQYCGPNGGEPPVYEVGNCSTIITMVSLQIGFAEILALL